MENFNENHRTYEPTTPHTPEAPASFQRAEGAPDWHADENSAHSFDDAGITAATTSALDHVRPAETGEAVDEAEAAETHAVEMRPPFPALEERHPLLNALEFRRYVNIIMPDAVDNTTAGKVMGKIVHASKDRSDELPPSEQIAYYVETHNYPEGEWAISLPNLRQHMEVIRDQGWLNGKVGKSVLGRIDQLPDGMPPPDTHADTETAKRAGWVFLDDPSLAELRETHQGILTSHDFANLAAEVDPGVNKHMVTRALGLLAQYSSARSSTLPEGAIPSAHRFQRSDGSIDWAISLPETQQNLQLLKGLRGLSGMAFELIEDVIALAQERANAAQEQPEL